MADVYCICTHRHCAKAAIEPGVVHVHLAFTFNQLQNLDQPLHRELTFMEGSWTALHAKVWPHENWNHTASGGTNTHTFLWIISTSNYASVTTYLHIQGVKRHLWTCLKRGVPPDVKSQWVWLTRTDKLSMLSIHTATVDYGTRRTASSPCSCRDHMKKDARMQTLYYWRRKGLSVNSPNLPVLIVQWSTLDSCMWWRHCSLNRSGVRKKQYNYSTPSSVTLIRTVTHHIIQSDKPWCHMPHTSETCILLSYLRHWQQISSKHFPCECTLKVT